MANDTDLLTSNDSSYALSHSNGEISRRQASLFGLDMSGVQDMAAVGSLAKSSDKLDSCVANGCVKLRDGTLDLHDADKPVVFSNNNAAHDGSEVVMLVQNTPVPADNQRSTANCIVTTRTDQLGGSADLHSQKSAEVSPNYLPPASSHASSELLQCTSSAETAQEPDLADSDKPLYAGEPSSCACSLQHTELSSNLSNLSITDNSGNPTVPCYDSVVAMQSVSEVSKIEYIVYESERQMQSIMQLITKDLSEPYSIYTYRYFIHNWPKLCFLVGI